MTNVKKEYVNIQTKEVLDMEIVYKLKDSAMIMVNPELWSEWDFEKNDGLGLDIRTITKGSKAKVWWICPKCESSYDCNPQNKLRNKNCPYCSGNRVNKTNSLLSLKPEIAKGWNYHLNDKSPDEITIGTTAKFWWICHSCKSDYEMSVANRVKNSICPYCNGTKVNHTNSLASLNPELAKQWHPTMNGELTPNDVTCGKNIRVWWICELEHEWENTINSRSYKNSGCPYCSGRNAWKGFNDMWTTNPELASLLDNPEDGYKYTRGSGQRVNWKCPDCSDTIYNKTINNVKERGLNCGICTDSLSFGEKMMYLLLKLNNIKFKYDQTTKFSNNKRYDFIIEDCRMIIETHGRQHSEDTGFSKMDGRTLEEEQENDRYKEELARENGVEHYIAIDTRYDDFEYVKNNIINSELMSLLQLDIGTFNNIDMSHSLSNECWTLWNINKMKKKDIAQKVGLHAGTVARYIKLREQLNNRLTS